MKLRALLIAALAALSLAAAPDPAERLPDPQQERRARSLFKEFRCLVCQNESIDDSDADLASDLRKLVRDQIRQGRSDGEIRSYLTERYGEFVLLKPRFSGASLALWLIAPGLLLGGGAYLLVAARGRRREPEPDLSAEEEARLAALVSGHAFAPEASHQSNGDEPRAG